jgi:ActR/RegA family two-component response regulator
MAQWARDPCAMLDQMSDSPTMAPSIVLVGAEAPLLTALSVTLERAGESAVRVHTASAGRMILAAAPTITTVICRCHQSGEQPGLTLLDELAAIRPDLALIGLCGQTSHAHEDGPNGCHYLAAPYELDDVRRVLAWARLDAYGRAAAL